MSSDRRRRHRAALRGQQSGGENRKRTRPRLEGLEDRVVLSFAPLPGEVFLTGPRDAAPLQIAREFLQERGDAFGLGAADLDRMRVINAETHPATGITHLYFRQTLNGLEVDGTNIGVHVDREGRVIAAGGYFSEVVGDLGDQGVPTPTLSAVDAITRATKALRLTVTGALVELSRGGDASRPVTFTVPGASTRAVPAFLNYSIDAQGGPRLTWDLEFWVPRSTSTYDVNVDAVTGEILVAHDRTWNATYNAVELPKDSPVQGRSLIVDPQLRAPVASPFGWHDTDGAAGAEFTDTRGNNVYAQEDTNGDDQGGNRPDGGAGLVFDFPFDPSQAPSAYTDAAITNLFYAINSTHDILHNYGFDEISGNFQQNNYGRGGQGNDYVIADAQDGSGANNAFWTPAPEGQNPRVTMLLTTLSTPNRDTDMDNEVVVHEYGHGVSTRLVGGPGDVSSLSTALHQPGALGEGWSDILALLLTQRPGDSRTAPEGIGEYAFPIPGNAGGVRTFGYSTDTSVYPRTYGDTQDNLQSFFVIHENGTIWANTLWEMNWLLIDEQGFEPDLHTPFDLDNPENNGGNQIALKLIIEGMKLTPARPTYLQARDAILQADLALFGGRYAPQIWSAFGKRGMGFGATDSGVPGSFGANESFEVPVFIDVAFNSAGLTGLFENTALNQVVVGTLTDRFGITDPSSYTATIDWGDGTPARPATLRPNASGGLDIIGSHTYLEGGNFEVTVEADRDGSLPSVSTFDLPVQSWPIFAEAGNPIVSQEGILLRDLLLGSFNDFDPQLNPSFHYTAVIDWGDGTQTPGRIAPRPNGGFNVFGEHTYREGGDLTYRVIVSEAGGQTSTAQGQAFIESFPITATGGFSYTVQEGTRFRGPIARFVDQSPQAKDARTYRVVIDWGDGTTGSAAVVADGAGAFTVLADHSFTLPQGGDPNLTITVTVTEGGGNSATATSTAVVADAPINVEGRRINAAEGAFSGVVARFDDFNLLGNAGEFTASISWGDGTTSPGLIQPDPEGGFLILGSRGNLRAGNFNVRVDVRSVGGSGGQADSALVVADAGFTPRGVPVSSVAGPFSGAVASFVDLNPNGLAGDFSAVIAWGDGTSSPGRIVRLGDGTFRVEGDHSYRAGTFTVGVTITSRATGNASTVTSRATIGAAPMTSLAVPVLGLELENGLYYLGAVYSDDPFARAGDFTVVIDWGDGTTSAGEVETHPFGPGAGFLIRGRHSYDRSGGFPITATITGPGGVQATISTAASMGVVAVPVVANLAPAGVVSGFAVPGSTVILLGQRDGGDPFLVSEIAASPVDGGWTFELPRLDDGTYTFSAASKNRSGIQNSPIVTIGGASLVVDRSGPTVEDVFLDPRSRQVLVTLTDSLSGLAPATLLSPANYEVTDAMGRALRIAGVELAPTGADGTQVVIIRLGGRAPLPRGGYTVTINGAGITDLAGNTLSESFFTPFPQFRGVASTTFVADLGTDGVRSTPPIPTLPGDQSRGAGAFRRFIEAGFRRRPVQV